MSAKAGARPDRPDMRADERAGRPPSSAQAGVERRAEPPHEPRQSALALTLILVLLLVVVGVGAYEASELLRQAIRPLTPNDLAALTCTAFTTQNYGLLTTQIDPAPVAQAASGTFNSQQVVNRLTQLDAALGRVSRCGYSPVGDASLTPGSNRQSYVLEMWRTHTPTIPSGVTLIVRKTAAGRWMISRESNFLTTAALAMSRPGTSPTADDGTFSASLVDRQRIQSEFACVDMCGRQVG